MRKPGEPLPVETLPRKELEKLQNRRLRYTVRQAYEHTLFWREKFDLLGIKPEDIKNKEDLLEAYKKGLKIDDNDLILNFRELIPDYLERVGYTVLTTSGTSKNVPKMIPYTQYDFARSNDQAFLLYNALGISKGVRNLNAFAPPPNTSGILNWIGLNALGASQYPLMIEVSPAIELKIIKSYRPQHIWKLGSKALELGNFLEKIGEDPTKLGVKKIEISGEPFSDYLKKKTEDIWKTELVDMYASAELSVTAFECPTHDGMHVAENRILLTVVDPETKEEKEEGQILATTLYDEGEYPGIYLINKEMGDATKIIDEECSCGRKTIRISPPIRIDDIFPIESKKFNARAVESLLYDDNFTGNYLVVKYTDKETGKLKKLEIRTEVKELKSPKRDLVPDVINAFTQSNPLTYGILEKLEKEGKIEVICTPEKRLYQGFEKYIRKGKSKRFIEVVS